MRLLGFTVSSGAHGLLTVDAPPPGMVLPRAGDVVKTVRVMCAELDDKPVWGRMRTLKHLTPKLLHCFKSNHLIFAQVNGIDATGATSRAVMLLKTTERPLAIKFGPRPEAVLGNGSSVHRGKGNGKGLSSTPLGTAM